MHYIIFWSTNKSWCRPMLVNTTYIHGSLWLMSFFQHKHNWSFECFTMNTTINYKTFFYIQWKNRLFVSLLYSSLHVPSVNYYDLQRAFFLQLFSAEIWWFKMSDFASHKTHNPPAIVRLSLNLTFSSRQRIFMNIVFFPIF
jgi:hypothetical protein